MAGTARADLVTALRSRIADERPAVAAFSLTVKGTCKGALLEIPNGILTVTVEQGSGIKSISLDLNDPRYNTVGRLMNALSRITGYDVTPDVSYVPEHPSIDIRVDGLPDISGGTSYTFKHRVFSDTELMQILDTALQTHNPNYTSLASVPKSEHPYVLMKATAQAYRMVAADSAKRRGLDADAKTFLALATDMEEQYARDKKSMERVIPAPKADESKIGSGDAVQGTFVRRSLRAGYTSPYRDALPPTPPDLLDPADDDVEDVQVRLRWSQNREQSFSYYEVWRDTSPKVERSISGRLANSGGNGSPQLPTTTQYSRFSTAKQVLGVSGGSRISPSFDGFFFWTAAELAGTSLVNATFIDGLIYNNPGQGNIDILGEPLEPNTDYYYRVYAINWNGEVVPSRVLKVRTKSFRAKFTRTSTNVLDLNSIAPQTGPLAGGTAITITGTGFVTGTDVQINGKSCGSIVVVSPTQITCTSPTFTNTAFVGKKLNVVLTSPNGLQDMAMFAWAYTA